VSRGVHDDFPAAEREEARNGGKNGNGQQDDQPAGQGGLRYISVAVGLRLGGIYRSG
jgi:hypothetical protein